ncbi:MAG: putative alpha/beta hydrolase family esterase [Planctomycetota bacterium]|jgi:predicted alpha/beta hydrolase family esterase
MPETPLQSLPANASQVPTKTPKGQQNQETGTSSLQGLTAFIIHDAYTNPQSHWYPWLASALQEKGYTVITPKFPTPEGQSLDYWRNTLDNHRESIHKNTIFIGHGIGCAFILRVIEKLTHPIRDIFLVAPYTTALGHGGFDTINSTFLEEPFSWVAIRERIRSCTVIYSDSDQYVKEELSLNIANVIPTKLDQVPGAGHFDSPSSYTQFPLLLKYIEQWESYSEATPEQQLKGELDEAGINYDPTQNEERKRMTLANAQNVGLSTYYTDMANTINQSNAGKMADTLRSERLKEGKKTADRKARRGSWASVFGAIFLILLGILIVKDIQLKPRSIEITNSYPSLISANTQTRINSTTASPSQMSSAIHTAISSKPLTPGVLHHLYVTKDTPTGPREIDSRTLIDLIPTRITNLFKQDIQPSYMLGAFHSSRYEPFLILTSESFQRGIDGMRDWEVFMAEDLQHLFSLDTELVSEELFAAQFESLRTENREVRILQSHRKIQTEEEIIIEEETNPTLPGEFLNVFLQPLRNLRKGTITKTFDGPTETVLVYTFLDESTILITTNEVVIHEIVNRIEYDQILR